MNVRDAATRELPDADLCIYVLGSFELYWRGERVEHKCSRGHSRLLIAMLAITPGHRLPTDAVTKRLGPKSDPDTAFKSLRVLGTDIRKTMSGERKRPSRALIEIRRDYITLHGRESIRGNDVDLSRRGVWVDALEFEKLASRAAREGDPLPFLNEAEKLYGGALLAHVPPADWILERRRVLAEALVEVRLALAHQYALLGELDAAVAQLSAVLEDEPTHQTAARQLVRMLLEYGHGVEARAVCERLTSALEAAGEAMTRDMHAQCDRAHADAAVVQLFLTSYSFPKPARLVGRADKLKRLEQVLGDTESRAQIVLIDGPEGAGKSALIGELVSRAQRRGVLALVGAGHAPRMDLPFTPFLEAIVPFLRAQPAAVARDLAGAGVRDLATLAPELGKDLGINDASPAPRRGRSKAPPLRAFGRLIRELAEARPVLLCIEDLHVADEDSLALFDYLARECKDVRLMLVGTFQDAAARSSKLALADQLRRDLIASSIHIDALDQVDTGEQIAGLLGGPVEAETITTIYEITEGNPLFVHHMVLGWSEVGGFAQRNGVWRLIVRDVADIPARVADVILRRLARLKPRARAVLEIGAVLGPKFKFDELSDCVANSDEQDLLDDLQELVDAQHLRCPDYVYQFAHATTRHTLLKALSDQRRHQLHATAAAVIEKLPKQRAIDYESRVAMLYRGAGPARQMRAKALEFTLRAGQRLAAISVFRGALDHLELACQLAGARDIDPDGVQLLEALQGRARAERELAHWEACIATCRLIVERTRDPVIRARAYSTSAFALQKIGQTDAALTAIDHGLVELAQAPAGLETGNSRLRLKLDKAVPLFVRGRFDDLVALGDEMLTEALHSGDQLHLCWARQALGMGYGARGDLVRAQEEQEAASEAAARRPDEKITMAVIHEMLGITLMRLGEYDSAQDQLDAALEKYDKHADLQRGVNTIQMLGRLALLRGSLDEAEAQATHGLALAEEVQHRVAAECHETLGAVHGWRGNWKAASREHNRALTIRRAVGHLGGIVESHLALGQAAMIQGHWRAAREHFAPAVQRAQEIQCASPHLVAALRHTGRLLVRSGRLEEGRAAIESAFSLVHDMHGSHEGAPTRLALAEVHLCMDRQDEAHACATDALEAGGAVGMMVEAHVLLTRLDVRARETSAAAAHAAEALRLAERVKAPYLLGLAHAAQAVVNALLDNDTAAATDFDTALTSFNDAHARYECAQVQIEYAELLDRSAQPDAAARARRLRADAARSLRQCREGLL